MGIMNDKPTVKEHCENWGRKHDIIMTADQDVEELKAENAKLKADCGETMYFYKEMGEKLADMETRNERLEAEIAKLQEENKALQEIRRIAESYVSAPPQVRGGVFRNLDKKLLALSLSGIAKLQKKQKRPMAECQCADCGETIYFYKLGPVRCACGGAELELTVNTTILED